MQFMRDGPSIAVHMHPLSVPHAFGHPHITLADSSADIGWLRGGEDAAEGVDGRMPGPYDLCGTALRLTKQT